MRPAATATLDALDPRQRAVAEALTGPVRVLAGAGTGKTRAITHRIAWGIEQQVYQPQSVLALTFTSKAAAELRLRLAHLGLPPVAARTFHAAALAQLRHFWPRTLGAQLPRLLSSKAAVIAEAVHAVGLPEPDTATLRDLAAQVEWRKVRALTVDQYLATPHRQVHGVADEQMAAVMLRYERLKDDRRVIDFEDVLLTLTGMLRQEPAVADEVRDQYRIFVVDEYQDVSPVQHDLLREWMGRRRDLCVVGDPSQTIYSFSGADPRYLLDFEQEFVGAQTVELTHNYRSSAPIVSLANAVMQGRPGAVRLETDVAGPPPQLAACADETDEAQHVARAVAAQIAGGASPREIAVLMRVNSQTARLEQAFTQAGVPFALRNATPFFARREIVDVMLLIGVAAAEQPSAAALPALERALTEAGWSPTPPAEAGEVRERWQTLEALRRVCIDAGEQTTLAALHRELLERREQQHPPTTETVTLSTVHAAKGLEWDHVHVIGLNEGLLPISTATTEAEIDEERRLFYVAVTRARRTLHLSYAERSGGRAAQRSRFLEGR